MTSSIVRALPFGDIAATRHPRAREGMTVHGSSEESVEIFPRQHETLRVSYDASVSGASPLRSAHLSALPVPPTMSPRARAPLALLVLILGAASSRAFQLFPAESHPEVDACVDEETRERLLITSAEACPRASDTTPACACRPAEEVSRGRHPLGLHGIGTLAALRHAVDGAVSRAREGLARFGSKPDAETGAAPSDDAQRDAFASLVDALGDIERQLFLAAPLAAPMMGRESPLEGALHHHFPPRRPFPPLGLAASLLPRLDDAARALRSAMDVRETPDAFLFVADVPGVRDEDLTVEVDEDARVLTVRGRREEEREVGDENGKEGDEGDEASRKRIGGGDKDLKDLKDSKDSKDLEDHLKDLEPGADATRVATQRRVHHARERHFGSFENRYAIPTGVDLSRVSAAVERGVLTVTAPKTKSTKDTPRAVRRVHVSRA
jgi:HSP20 family molecular chaperone IbpA